MSRARAATAAVAAAAVLAAAAAAAPLVLNDVQWAHCYQLSVDGGWNNEYMQAHGYQYKTPSWQSGPCPSEYTWFNRNETIAPGVVETTLGVDNTTVGSYRCDLCKITGEMIGNGIFDTFACEHGVESAVKKVCNIAEEYKIVCEGIVDAICDTCRHLTKDHCSWKSLVDRECDEHHFC